MKQFIALGLLVLIGMTEIARAADAIDISEAEMSALLESPAILAYLTKQSLKPGIESIGIDTVGNNQSRFYIKTNECHFSFEVRSHIDVSTGRAIVDSTQYRTGACASRDVGIENDPKLTLNTSIAEIHAILNSQIVNEQLRRKLKNSSYKGITEISRSGTYYKIYSSKFCWMAVDAESHVGSSGKVIVDSIKPKTGSCS